MKNKWDLDLDESEAELSEDGTLTLTFPEGETDLQFHVLPHLDCVEHYESPSCICEPELHYRNPETRNEVWVHRRIEDERQ